MFALEIDFADGISLSETLLLGRLINIVGASPKAHLEIDGAKSTEPDVKLVRRVARNFYYQIQDDQLNIEEANTWAEFYLSSMRISVTSLDADLLLRDEENIKDAAKRILETATLSSQRDFPCILINSHGISSLSLGNSSKYIIGRSRSASIRVDDQTVSDQHLSIEVINGDVWIEDLNSRNGTFVNDNRLTGKVSIKTSDHIRLGHRTSIKLYDSFVELEAAERTIEQKETVSSLSDDMPSVISSSSLVQPQDYAFLISKILRVGRDPTSDIWVGATHVSRLHLEIRYTEEGVFEVKDYSTNGSFLDGSKMPREIWLTTKGCAELDLGNNVLLYLCESKADRESAFKKLEEKGETLKPLNLSNYDSGLSNLAATSARLASQYSDKLSDSASRQKTTILSDSELGIGQSTGTSSIVSAIVILIFFVAALVMLMQLFLFN